MQDFYGLGTQSGNFCLNEGQVEEGLNKFNWKVKDYYEQNGRFLFNAYDLDNTGCLGLRDFVLMLLTEVTNNNKESSPCLSCMKKTKKELGALFAYLDSDNNGLLTAEGLFRTFDQNFATTIRITSSMANHFILVNDGTGKAAVNRKEFVDGCALGIAERTFNNVGWDDADTPMIAIRDKN